MHAINTKSVGELILGLSIGQQIRHIRKVRGLTQKQLAELINTGQPAISRVEDDNYLPSLSFLIKIATVLGKRVQVKLK